MKLPENIKNQLKERLAELPTSLQEAITSDAVTQNIRAITEKHSLNLWQGQLLENEVLITLLGLEPRKSFAKNIRSQLEIDEGQAARVTQDINEKIFKSIREIVQEEDSSQEGPELPQTARAPFSSNVPDSLEVKNTAGDLVLETPTDNQIGEDPLSQPTREESSSITLPKESSPQSPPKKKRPYSTDPYREPIE